MPIDAYPQYSPPQSLYDFLYLQCCWYDGTYDTVIAVILAIAPIHHGRSVGIPDSKLSMCLFLILPQTEPEHEPQRPWLSYLQKTSYGMLLMYIAIRQIHPTSRQDQWTDFRSPSVPWLVVHQIKDWCETWQRRTPQR